MNLTRVRSVFISDVHLGTRACQAESLLGFLRDYSAEHLFMVGDIVDFWAMKREVRWTAAQNTVVQKILRRARHGEKVTFIPGNHDEALREHVGIRFGEIALVGEHVHTMADGKRYLVIHGDEFDQVTRYHRWIAVLGDIAYNGLVRVNVWLSWLRRRLGIAGYWSLAGYAKRKVKLAVSFVGDFERSVARAVRDRGLDGVICGHIHVAAMRKVDGIDYVNCGDWVDSCTAIVEHHDGRLELIEWGKREAAPIDADLVATLQSLATLQPRAGATATEHRASRDSPSRSA
ncbi:MAG TPA: UDP-2,3-diacylglucosamine diphosphatase [Dokdonella sp.]|uniref:UDP-2,3-diacylglucosamine diphosphatase n=1 Tax=Dokdonella sp. TaxID=2291710 RepID=UPI002C5DCE9C|nr:UDP-2,3-diacylglucosamine diphosphatase [Dokdonella sp.]HOX72708.1 UDP-2,3-diacylglucosamine diphosphatase [Dokdonella sp.]HPG93328.1 UDP-2,3-diacylglucosamine diphosphatase [Dokdonella sp.]HPN78644.1 UDP-2,3-diacylglucosamine diphosphatase [Dokdonella sp.]